MDQYDINVIIFFSGKNIQKHNIKENVSNTHRQH